MRGKKKELREAFTIKQTLEADKLITAQDIENLDLTNLQISIMDGRTYSWTHKNFLSIKGVHHEYACKERNHVNKFLWFIFQSECYFDDSKKTIEIRGYDINKLNKDLKLNLKFKNDEYGGKQGTAEDKQKLTQYVKDCQAKVVQDLKNLDLNEKQGLFDFVKVDILGFSKSK